jgi:hypothetical protein
MDYWIGALILIGAGLWSLRKGREDEAKIMLSLGLLILLIGYFQDMPV